MAKKSKKKTGLQIIRERERKRRMVPPVVLRRRIAAQSMREDPGAEVLVKAKYFSARHAKALRDLLIRSKGLADAPAAVKRRFEIEGLEGVGLDGNAKALINNATNKISEILLFRLVATELVNDAKLRDEMVNLFMHQRFDAMGRAYKPPTTPGAQIEDPYARERKGLEKLLRNFMDV